MYVEQFLFKLLIFLGHQFAAGSLSLTLMTRVLVEEEERCCLATEPLPLLRCEEEKTSEEEAATRNSGLGLTDLA